MWGGRGEQARAPTIEWRRMSSEWGFWVEAGGGRSGAAAMSLLAAGSGGGGRASEVEEEAGTVRF